MTEPDVRPLWDELKLIRIGQAEQRAMLDQHMTNSANNHESLKCEIAAINITLTKAVADTREIYNSLPEDDHGRASPFIHKTHHGLKGEFDVAKMGDRRTPPEPSNFWNDILKDVTKYAVISILGVVVVVTGTGAKDLLSFYFKPQPLSVQEQAPRISTERFNK